MVLLGLGSLVGVPESVDAQTLVATLTYPTDGAVNADMSQPIAWTTVANVQAYYLYVGTTAGANNLVNTGATQATSYLAAGLPAGQTLYARMWAQVGGVWRYTDSTFSAAASVPVTATITYPVNGAVNANMSQPIAWTTVANAQAYYLYVGTAVGTNNLVNTGAITATSYLASGLPAGQTLYARMWAQVGGVWRYTDSTFSAAASVPLTATITYPANGAANADMSQPIAWTTVANVQAYYLYVGTTPGANNLVNTGAIAATSYLASGLPSGQTLYARMWAQVGGVWRYADSTFSAAASAPVTATITYPANGANGANMLQPIAWTTVANAQAYYLYVGTTAGANNLVNTGETQQTSQLASSLPPGQTLYARMWTKVGGVWRYTDSTFTAAVQPATITYPANGATNADMTLPIHWTSATNVQAYYLYVGTTAGANNLVDSGETQQTSYLAENLPQGQSLYIQLWTKVGGVWASSASTFSAAALTATLTYPADGAAGIDQWHAATWTSVPNAQAYYLYIGTTLGAKDLVDSSELLGTTLYPISEGLPAGPTLYARLWTKVGGVWRHHDSTFTAAPVAPVFTYPLDGALAVGGGQAFQWTPPGSAQAHQLIVGTSPGASDLFDSGAITGTSVLVPGLPATGTVYARVSSQSHNAWRHTDIAFTLEASSPASTIVTPADGELGFDTFRPFSWLTAPLARSYRLSIGTTPGGNDLHDSGEIHVTQRFVPNLPIGPLFGRLETKINGQWYANDFVFSVGANTTSTAQQVKSALWATDVVRSMASVDSRPFSWELLFQTIGHHYVADCDAYAEALLQILAEMNTQLQARRLDVALSPNGFDGHTLVEMFNPATQSWMLLDPTFDMTVRRTGDGGFATAENVSAATRSQQWGNVSYEFLGVFGDVYARNYYLDYPLLFVDVYHVGDPHVNGQGAPVLPYLETVAMPVSVVQVYAVGCLANQTAELLIDLDVSTVWCNGVDGLSPVFSASNVSSTAQTSSSVTLYRPRRFVF